MCFKGCFSFFKRKRKGHNVIIPPRLLSKQSEISLCISYPESLFQAISGKNMALLEVFLSCVIDKKLVLYKNKTSLLALNK